MHTGLFSGAVKGDIKQVEGLIKAGCHPDTYKDSFNATSVHAAAAGGHTECLRVLVEAGGTLTATDDYGDTPLHRAVHNSHSDTVKWIIDHPDGRQCINMERKRGSDNKTPLDLAMESGDAMIIQLFLPTAETQSSLCSGEIVHVDLVVVCKALLLNYI